MPAYPDPASQNELAADCRRCPGPAADRECIAWGSGPPDAEVVVVGEAPGYGSPDADRWQGGNWTGLAYTSRHSGRRVRELLATAGFGPAATYFTNAVKCFPADPDEPTTNREPTAEERANCRPYLREEIATVDPRTVVATGKHATRSVLALEGVELDGFLDAVLGPVVCEGLETTVLPLLHPSYQEVWRSRLGYTAEEYVAAVADALAG